MNGKSGFTAPKIIVWKGFRSWLDSCRKKYWFLCSRAKFSHVLCVIDGSRNRTLIGWEIASFPPPASALRIRHRLPPIVRRPMLPSPPPSSLAVLGPPFLLRSLLRLRRRRGVIVGAVWDQPIVVGAVEEVARCRLGRRGPARLRRGRQVSFLYFSFSFSFIFANNDFNLH